MASYSKQELDEIFDFNSISEAVVHKLLNRTSHKYWDKRGGMDGYQRSTDNLSEFYDYLTQEQSAFANVDGQTQRAIEGFNIHVYNIIHSILKDDYMDITTTLLHTEYVRHRTYYFILGAPRTGGHYLLKQLHKCLGINLEDLSPQFSTDAVLGEKQTFFWDKPQYFIPFLKQFSEFIVWANMSYPDDAVVIKKSLRLAGAMKALDYLLKDRASYVVCVRHPQSCLESLYELYGDSIEKGIGQDWMDEYVEDAVFRDYYLQDSEDVSVEEKFLNYWKNIYYEIVMNGRPHGKIHLVIFGRDTESFVYNFAENCTTVSDRDHIDAFRIRNRRTRHTFWDSKQVEETIDQVRSVWKMHGYTFPSAKELIY